MSESLQSPASIQEQTEAILQDPAREPLARIQAVMQMACWPESLFQTWACDCAERALQHEAHRGSTPDPAFWQLLSVQRQRLQGTCSDHTLQEALQQAQVVAHRASLHPVGYEAYMAVVDAGRDVAYALRAAAWALAAVSQHAPPTEAEALRHQESLWQLTHFHQLWLESFAKPLV